MIVKSVTETKRKMAALLDAVEEDRTPVLITRGSKPPAVLLSYDEYRSWQETMHLLSTPANVKRLDMALESYRNGKVQEREIDVD